MDIAKRKKKIGTLEAKLAYAERRLNISHTVVRRWRSRLRAQERALVKELEAQVGQMMPVRSSRQFLEE